MTEATQGWNRRDFLGGAALLALALGVPVGALSLTSLPADEAPTDRQRLLARHVSQLVIPRTETPGAGDVGTGDFLILALVHGLEGTRAPVVAAAMPALGAFQRGDGSLRHLAWLEHELDRRANGDFLARSSAQGTTLLAALDAEAYAEGAPSHPWKPIKALILTGYYTSEVGGSQELRYEIVPGRFDPDLPATAQTRAWSSDWTAVDFG
ncbi:gluconate 2-dehydrogenase subunit 3 family protein [Novosphingobium cyanobacteriorum]|uniref:Gluconate 2-dehydrogenase subunit 3 family protein n=1 Tax=Novosphingobium cyanobacteriorum TaxID=3024215 RepID=A0ABT6CN87_9SPHN|nr:gluconate 2-dehydrogenase subunit 3 family protein [Novosphingobium cyanobacteriorum]MDF8333797.1 gluconate 2-dehydrogenase subunit 3 family protein [Novosphingobium cyanobacteriorum]